MAFKGIFDALKGEVTNEIGRQINKRLGGGGSAGGGGGPAAGGSQGNMDLVQGIFGLIGNLSGGGGGGAGGGSGSGGGPKGLEYLGTIINAIQGQNGGLLPGNIGKYLPLVLKLAEVIGHGMGDDSPRTERNSDGSFIDDFIKTIIGGRKIFGGGGKGGVRPIKKQGGGDIDELDFGGGSGVFQNYDEIRNQCLEEGALFEDPEFRAEDASVFFSSEGRRNFQWLRPHEIADNPAFFVGDEGSRFDVQQGELGDCWLLAALANLTLNEQLFKQVVPEDNSFEDGYAGIFHFRFWQYGTWVDVCVDDRLPCINGKLMFMHSEEKNEFWSALLEKAYAKMHGSYEALKGGTTCEALEDFTGGVTEMYDITKAPQNLLEMMVKAFERGSFLGCSIEPDPNVLEAATSSGLIRGHAYSVTDLRMLDIQTPRVTGKIPLLRIRNPWGNEVEWNGAWSDGSKEWNAIDDDTKEDLGLVFDADGEFWMTFKDFSTHFDRLEFCNLSPDCLTEECYEAGGKRKWKLKVFDGAWDGSSAGGCRNYLDTFANNPQYVIDLEDQDEDGRCTVIIALMQKNRRARRKHGVDCLTIGFAIYKLNGSEEHPLSSEFFKFNASCARSPTFINLREVSCRFKLDPGSYAIVPSTFEPNQEGEFIIRVFTE